MGATSLTSGAGVYGVSSHTGGTGVRGTSTSTSTSGFPTGVHGRLEGPAGRAVWAESTSGSGNTVGIYAETASATGIAGVFEAGTSPSANILVGRRSSLNVFRVDSNGKGFFNGGTPSNGADFAESFDVVGEVASYSPGDVLVIDADSNRRVRLSDEPYSSLVSGIYSTKPGLLATPHDMDDPALNDNVPMAVIGVVLCKVSSENGPIKRGDLLVTSSLPGHAMKGTDRSRMLGAIVGKALQPFHPPVGPDGKPNKKATGVIEVLVTLQ